MQDGAALARPRDRDIGQPPFFLQTVQPAFVQRPLRGENAFLPPDQEGRIELQPLGGMDGHDGDLGGLGLRLIIHNQRDMLQKRAQRLIFFHSAREFREVLQPPRAFGAAFGLQHRGIAALVQYLPRQFRMRQLRRPVAPARQIADETAERPPRLRRQFVGVQYPRGGMEQRNALGPRQPVQLLHRLVAQAALGHIDDPLERQIVGRLVHQPQIGQRIADFGALIEAEAADDAIGQADLDEAILELAGLVLRAHQYGDFVQRTAIALDRLDLLADPPRFLRPVPYADDAHLLAHIDIGPQCLAEPRAILGDHPGCSAQYMRGRSIILLQLDDRRAGKILFEPQDIGDLCATP